MCTARRCLGTALKPRLLAFGRPGCQPSSSCRPTHAPASHNGVHRAWAFRHVPPTPCYSWPLQANCATMAWESPLDEMLHPGPTLKSSFIGVCEWAYLGIFTFELLTKVLAYGFIRNREAYLRDAWCQLDFVVVTLARRLVDTPPIHSAMIAPATHPVAPPACSMGGCRTSSQAQAALTASWKPRRGRGSPPQAAHDAELLLFNPPGVGSHLFPQYGQRRLGHSRRARAPAAPRAQADARHAQARR
eukprot:scaffold8721_cov80-Phaeocystis_antarctica.AAC.42